MSHKNTKDYTVVIQDFIASLPTIDHLNARLKYKQVEYILYLNLNEGHNGICFVLTDGYSVYWIKQFEYRDFESIRHKLGMEGTYDGYFEILKDSILNKSVMLEIDQDYSANLQVKYQISKGVTLNGLFELGPSIKWDRDVELFRKVNQNFLFDLQKYMELTNKRSEDNIKELNDRVQRLQNEGMKSKKGEIVGTGMGGNVAGPKKESMKQKAKTDLVNPNRKKVKGKGAKFNVENFNLSVIGEENNLE